MKPTCKKLVLPLLLLLLTGTTKARAQGKDLPLFSIGAAGVVQRPDNELIIDNLINNDFGVMAGVQFDADLRLLSTNKAAVYFMVNFSEPQIDTDIPVATVENPNGTGETLTYAYQFRSVGTRIAIRTFFRTRFWFEGGSSFLKAYAKNNPSEGGVTPELVHGWYVGTGGTSPLLPWLSLYFRLAYTSTPSYESYYSDNHGNIATTRTELGGYSAALGIRFDL